MLIANVSRLFYVRFKGVDCELSVQRQHKFNGLT